MSAWVSVCVGVYVCESGRMVCVCAVCAVRAACVCSLALASQGGAYAG